MPEYLEKLRPDRDLQCYFERPSAVAALSGTSATGFTVSGCWRQQFDWAVVEWNRDNGFEHPWLRNLPDGNLSGIHLSYEETRENCIALDSNLYPTVDWPYLRVWSDVGNAETLYKVPLKGYAAPIEGTWTSATVEFELQGSPANGDYIELAWLSEHYNYAASASDTPAMAIAALAQIINNNSSVQATVDGARITLAYPADAGANGNRIGVYGTVHGSGGASWKNGSQAMTGGTSPARWRVNLDFGSLTDSDGRSVPTANVRKLRWTWVADLQRGEFQRSEFAVTVSNWTVTGENIRYRVAGPGSRRIEDTSRDLLYNGAWTEDRGNYSGGSIRKTVNAGAEIVCAYNSPLAHSLYLGTRRVQGAGSLSVTVDNGPAQIFDLNLDSEDVLVRIPLGEQAGQQSHNVRIRHNGPQGAAVYFDFLEAAAPAEGLPEIGSSPRTTLATDWDTDHSIAIAPERTAWLIHKLGFTGRANHYAGALWFYELVRPGHRYAAATVTFSGVPEFSKTTTLQIGPTVLEHVNLIGDTAGSVAKAFEFLINSEATGVWAQAEGTALTITSRAMGAQANGIAVTSSTGSTVFTATASGALSGGNDGEWRTDLSAIPRLNRAARDWTRSYLVELKRYGIDAAAAFSMELQHGDPSPDAGIAQRYPDGEAVTLNTPALQTNFSVSSVTFWQQVYLEAAANMAAAGHVPYLQFGEVQWWYFPNASGMPFYDEYTKSRFQQTYGRPLPILSSGADPAQYSAECGFLAALIGQFTDAIMATVRASFPDSRFEVLYPPDVNETPLNTAVNLPRTFWTSDRLNCLKTENFTYTGERNLDKARAAVLLPMGLGFARGQASHLIGIGEYTTPWLKEQSISEAAGVESVVLFALDQFCLIGYPAPLRRSRHRGTFSGA